MKSIPDYLLQLQGKSVDQIETPALVIDLAGTAAHVLWTRGKVTPVDEPRAADGTPLVPADRSLYQGGDYTGRHRDPDGPTQYDRLHDGEEG